MRANRFLLSFYDGVIETADTPGRLPEVHSTSHVSSVTTEYSTKVEDNKFIFFQQLAGGARVRDISVGGDAFGFCEDVNRAYVIR